MPPSQVRLSRLEMKLLTHLLYGKTNRDSSLRLETAIIERIVGYTASEGSDDRDSRRMLSACYLAITAEREPDTLDIHDKVVLRHQQDMARMEAMLQNYPYLINRIRHLVINVKDTEAQPWVSAIPLSLPFASMKLEQLCLIGVDLSQVYPAFDVLRKVRLIHFEDVRFTRYSQVTRLVRAVQASTFVWTVHKDASTTTNTDESLPAAVDPRARILLPQCVDTLEWDMPWGVLEKMMQSLLQEASMSWPRCLDLRPRELPQNIPRTTCVAVLGLLMQIYEWFYVGRRDHKINFESGSVLVNLDGE